MFRNKEKDTEEECFNALRRISFNSLAKKLDDVHHTFVCDLDSMRMRLDSDSLLSMFRKIITRKPFTNALFFDIFIDECKLNIEPHLVGTGWTFEEYLLEANNWIDKQELKEGKKGIKSFLFLSLTLWWMLASYYFFMPVVIIYLVLFITYITLTPLALCAIVMGNRQLRPRWSL